MDLERFRDRIAGEMYYSNIDTFLMGRLPFASLEIELVGEPLDTADLGDDVNNTVAGSDEKVISMYAGEPITKTFKLGHDYFLLYWVNGGDKDGNLPKHPVAHVNVSVEDLAAFETEVKVQTGNILARIRDKYSKATINITILDGENRPLDQSVIQELGGDANARIAYLSPPD